MLLVQYIYILFRLPVKVVEKLTEVEVDVDVVVK